MLQYIFRKIRQYLIFGYPYVCIVLEKIVIDSTFKNNGCKLMEKKTNYGYY